MHNTRRVAIVHDWLTTVGGAEKVLEHMLSLFPNAALFTLVFDQSKFEKTRIAGRVTQASFIQKLPFGKKKYRSYLPLMPLAVEQFDLSGFDLIISSSFAVAKGVITGPDQLHVSYVHSPIRYAWDLQHQYLREAGLEKGVKGLAAKWLLHKMRIWDQRTANSVDSFVANSNFVSRRIWKTYRRQAKVIYPPVDVESFAVGEQKEDFYITASRMVPYKRMDLIVETFSAMPDRRLVVIGDGPDYGKVKAKAGGNIELLGYQSTDVLRDYMRRAKAFVFAAEEDFGITPVEAQACGTPVIAFGKGGALETVRGRDPNGQGCGTGIFFYEQTSEALADAVQLFEENQEAFTPEVCRQNAERFSVRRFLNEFESHVEEAWDGFASALNGPAG